MEEPLTSCGVLHKLTSYGRIHLPSSVCRWQLGAAFLDGWLACDSKAVLGGKWDHVKELETKA
jgi:hypothetical protein